MLSDRKSMMDSKIKAESNVVVQISDNQDSLDMDPQENSFTRTIDEEAELEERADREREDGHQDQDEEEEDREHEVMTAGSKYSPPAQPLPVQKRSDPDLDLIWSNMLVLYFFLF